jgi:hypothetical protein
MNGSRRPYALTTTFGCEKGSDFVPYTPPILRAGNFGNKKSTFLLSGFLFPPSAGEANF